MVLSLSNNYFIIYFIFSLILKVSFAGKYFQGWQGIMERATEPPLGERTPPARPRK